MITVSVRYGLLQAIGGIGDCLVVLLKIRSYGSLNLNDAVQGIVDILCNPDCPLCSLARPTYMHSEATIRIAAGFIRTAVHLQPIEAIVEMLCNVGDDLNGLRSHQGLQYFVAVGIVARMSWSY